MISKHVNSKTGKTVYICSTDTRHKHRTLHAANRCVERYLRKYAR